MVLAPDKAIPEIRIRRGGLIPLFTDIFDCSRRSLTIF